MNIIAHPKVASFQREGFLSTFTLEAFAKKEFYREEISCREDFLKLVHTERHIAKIKRACTVKARLAEMKLIPESFEIACLSVGTVILASDEDNFAIQRLTGHHAGRDTAMGFNLFNSIAVAVQRLVDQGKKVCIIDIDGHHGNGTQNIFYRSNKVLYCSIHQKGAFPGTGDESEEGSGPGRGYTLNIPIPKGSGDDVFLGALRRVIERATDFAPDRVGVYAGFDGYHSDRLLNLRYSLRGFRECGKMVGQSFSRVFAVLGGGYHHDLGACVAAFISGFNSGHTVGGTVSKDRIERR